MKQVSKIIAALLVGLLSVPVYAEREDDGRRDWQEKMKAEKVAFLTSAMELTSAEAENFWPIYNNMESERHECFGKTMKAYKALDEAVKADKSEKVISTLLNSYFEAVQETKNIDAKYTESFAKVISVKKIAKMFIGEEEFRKQQISRWHGGRQGNPPQGGPQRPQGPRPQGERGSQDAQSSQANK